MLSLSIAVSLSRSAAAVDVPMLREARVDARVTADASSGISSFSYRVTNGSTTLVLSSFNVDIRSDQGREAVSGAGLSFVEPFSDATTELTLSKLGPGNYVPVGVSGQPAGWSAGVRPPADLAWGRFRDGSTGGPADVVTPLVATSRGLPGIRDAAVVPDVYDYQPDIEETDVEPGDVVAAVQASIQRLRTVGPVAPPKNLDVVAFADYIGSLRDEAAALGWVRSGSGMSSVDSLLAQVRAQLASGTFGAARTSANAFIAAVEAGSCTEFDCPSHMPTPPSLQTAPAHVWLGLKNSDDQGTQFDVRVALYSNETLVAEGLTRCVTGITRNAAQAKDVAVAFADSTSAPSSGATLRLEVSTRVGTNPDGTKCAGHNNAVGLRLYYDAASRASAFGAALGSGDPVSYFLRSSGTAFTLDPAAPTGTSAKQKDSGSVNFNGGNPWAMIGSWSLVVP